MNLKSFRAKLNLSQAELSKRINIPTATLFNYEVGKCEPNIESLIKLANFYNVSLDELVGREADTINLKYLNDNEAYLIRKIL